MSIRTVPGRREDFQILRVSLSPASLHHSASSVSLCHHHCPFPPSIPVCVSRSSLCFIYRLSSISPRAPAANRDGFALKSLDRAVHHPSLAGLPSRFPFLRADTRFGPHLWTGKGNRNGNGRARACCLDYSPRLVLTPITIVSSFVVNVPNTIPHPPVYLVSTLSYLPLHMSSTIDSNPRPRPRFFFFFLLVLCSVPSHPHLPVFFSSPFPT
ncbi:hypothetical protein C8Q78DRAFT_266379 [Trametes maxima]|nr:hypothetical protein C8Q78DRAFT_266379 [Trametes maxima]